MPVRAFVRDADRPAAMLASAEAAEYTGKLFAPLALQHNERERAS